MVHVQMDNDEILLSEKYILYSPIALPLSHRHLLQ